MDRRRLITIAVAAVGTIGTLVGLAAFFELTSVPTGHYEIGWIVTMLGCALMAWKLRSNVYVTLLVCAAFVVVVRYAAFTFIYALLESAVLWKLFADAPIGAEATAVLIVALDASASATVFM